MVPCDVSYGRFMGKGRIFRCARTQIFAVCVPLSYRKERTQVFCAGYAVPGIIVAETIHLICDVRGCRECLATLALARKA